MWAEKCVFTRRLKLGGEWRRFATRREDRSRRMESDAERRWSRICPCAIPRHIGWNTDANSNGYTDRNTNSYSYCHTDGQSDCNTNSYSHSDSNGNANSNATAKPNAKTRTYTEISTDAGPSFQPMITLISGSTVLVNLTILLLIPPCS